MAVDSVLKFVLMETGGLCYSLLPTQSQSSDLDAEGQQSTSKEL